MFRNVRFYLVDGKWPDSEEALSQHLEGAGFEPCGPLTERSAGWVPVDPDATGPLARRVGGADLVRLRSQTRVLPAAAINEELEARIVAFRQRMREAPSPREKRRLKAETRDELLPKALLKSDKIWGFVDVKEQIIGVDTAQAAAAERFVQLLQGPIRSVNIRPLQYKKPLAGLLTGIFLGRADSPFAVGRECRMQDASDTASFVRWTGFDLSDRTIRGHVADGMRLTHLAIEYDNVMSCVLDENGVITKLRFIGMDDDGEDHDDPLARQDAEFVLITGTLRRLVGDLKKLLDGFGQTE